MTIALYVVQIIISVTLVTIILLQGKGSGIGSTFGGSGGIYRTRRGVEKLLFQVTIGLAILFFFISLFIVALPK